MQWRRKRNAMLGQSKRDLRVSNQRRSSSRAKPIYIFRCGESGLYTFTADPKGHILPSQMYSRIHWRLERTILLRLDGNSPGAKIFDAIEMHGFHLAHASVDEQLSQILGNTMANSSFSFPDVELVNFRVNGGTNAKGARA